MLDQNNHDEFEGLWQDAFDDAALGPDEHVWERIDNQLDKEEAQGLRKQIVYYKWAVAASVSLLMTVLAYLTFFEVEDDMVSNIAIEYNGTDISSESSVPSESNTFVLKETQQHKSGGDAQNSNLKRVSAHQDVSEKVKASNGKVTDTGEDKPVLNLFSSLYGYTRSEVKGVVDGGYFYLRSLKDNSGGFDHFILKNGMFSMNKEEDNRQEKTFLSNKKQDISPLNLNEVVSLGIKEDMPLIETLNGDEIITGKKSAQTKFFAGLSLGTDVHNASMFSSGNGLLFRDNSADMNTSATAFNQPENTSRTVVNFSYGVNGGVNLAKNWVLQTGLHFSTYSLTSVSFLSLNASGGESYPYYQPALKEGASARYAVSNSTPYNINSTFNYLSIPFKAGYVIGMKRLSLNLSVGLLTDWFLNNVVSGEGNQFDKMVIRSGEDQPFQSVYLSSLVSSDINYKVTGNYTVSLSPFYRHGINLSGAPDYFVNNRPYSLGLNFGLKYYF